MATVRPSFTPTGSFRPKQAKAAAPPRKDLGKTFYDAVQKVNAHLATDGVRILRTETLRFMRWFGAPKEFVADLQQEVLPVACSAMVIDEEPIVNQRRDLRDPDDDVEEIAFMVLLHRMQRAAAKRTAVPSSFSTHH